MKDGLKESDRAAIRSVLAQFAAIQKAVLFGSRATGTYSPASDIDLVLYGDSLTLGDEFLIASRIEDLGLPFRVDLVRYSTITSKDLLGHIRRDGKLFYEGMASEWRLRDLGELTENFDSLRVPVKEADRRAGPYPYYGASGIVDHVDSFLFDGEHLLIAEDGENLRTRNTPIAFLARGKFWVNNHAHIVRGNREADTRFLMYALAVADISGYLTGSTMPKLTQGNMHRLPLLAPPVDEQRAIAHILGTLDDKIELNRRMNETLEAMARALFKSWFVDFDPVRAKAEGRDPGLPKHLADLFPDSFEDSELGEIPKGWSTVPLYDIATYVNGAAYAAFQPNDERRGLPIIKIAELKAGVTAQTKFSDIQMPEKYRVTKGEILFSWSGNPDTSIDTFVWSAGPGWLNQHIFKVLPRRQHERSFVLSTLKTFRPVFAEIARNKQTTGLGHVTAEDMKRLLVARPDDRVMQAWGTVAEPFHGRAFQYEIGIHSLAELRDTLLPKLISGELRVKDAARFLDDRGV